MSANIDTSNGRDNIAFLGSRNDIWHRRGNEMQPGMSIDQWATAAGLDWEAVLVPAYADLGGIAGKGMTEVPDRYFNTRNDTGAVLGYASGRYQNVQPRGLLDWFQRYTAVDSRFELDVAGSLGIGETVWATARFNGDMTVAGEKHIARLLMSTTYDGSGSTRNQGTMTRTVCQNTLIASHWDKRAVVLTRHSTKFNPDQVAKELAAIAKGFEQYKLMGDALAQAQLTREQTADYFKAILDIPKDAKQSDISTRKQNQYLDLARALSTSVSEGAQEGSAWAALQAVTRYVDHDRSTRGGDNEDAARFESANFGSGNALKGKAMDLLMPRIRELVPVLA